MTLRRARSTHRRLLGASLTAALIAAPVVGSGPATGLAPAQVAAPSSAPVASSAPTAPTASPLDDPFYDYTGRKPLRKIKPGTVLKRREVPYSIQGLDLPIRTIQLLYRTRNQLGKPVVNATTVVRPLLPVLGSPRVVSYQSFYDSLDPADQPSAAIAGGQGLGAAIVNIETLLIAPLLLLGYTVNIPDTEGQTANFASGPEYGYTTLDSLRALPNAKGATGVGARAPIGLIGYSGGAIASEWAAELAPSYSPAVARRIVGTAMGGVLVHPGKNLHYVEGSQIWAGVMPMALVGISRAFEVDLAQYANAYGKQVMAEMEKATIAEVLGAYPGLTWRDIAKKKYPQPEMVRAFVRVANQLIMGTGGTPSAPLFVGQGTGGTLEGTPEGGANIGAGDGVMIAGDVRTLVRKYCRRDVDVQYREYPLSHFTSVATWLPEAYAWLLARFGDAPVAGAPNNCASVAPGNSLAPLRFVKR